MSDDNTNPDGIEQLVAAARRRQRERLAGCDPEDGRGV
jgi:hypothetical protein